MTIGGTLMFTIGDTSMGTVYGCSILLGASTGMVMQASYTVGGIKTMTRTGSGLDVQRVLSMINLSQLGCQLGSLLVCGQIFQSLAVKNLTRVLDGLGFSADDITRAVAGTQSTVFDSLSPTLRQEAIKAITDAMSRVYILSFTVGAIMAVCPLMMKKERLFGATDPALAGKA
jgi:hypothetical protein